MSDTFQIEKNVPLPNAQGVGARKYPFDTMGVGDSFVVPSAQNRAGLYSSAKYAGIKITIRVDGDGFRVWRTA